MFVKNTKENKLNQENGKDAHEESMFPFIKDIPLEEDWKRMEEEAEEAYQAF